MTDIYFYLHWDFTRLNASHTARCNLYFSMGRVSGSDILVSCSLTGDHRLHLITFDDGWCETTAETWRGCDITCTHTRCCSVIVVICLLGRIHQAYPKIGWYERDEEVRFGRTNRIFSGCPARGRYIDLISEFCKSTEDIFRPEYLSMWAHIALNIEDG